MLFDYFNFINGSFPTTNEHTFVLRATSSPEVNGGELNIKKLCGKFRGTNSHGIVSSQFLAALNIIFNGGGEDLSQRFIEEFYQNMTISAISMNNSFKFDAFAELLTSPSVFFR